MLGSLPFKLKIVLSPLAVIVFMTAIWLGSRYGFNQQGEALDEVVDGSFGLVTDSGELMQNVADAQSEIFRLMVWGRLKRSSDELDAIKSEVDENLKAVELLSDKLFSDVKDNSEDLSVGKSLRGELDSYLTAANRAADMARRNPALASAVVVSATSSYDELRLMLEEFNQKTLDETYAARKTSEESISNMSFWLTAAFFTALFLAILLTWFVTKNLKDTMNGVIANLSKIRDGDLTNKLEVRARRNDEFDKLAESINEMTQGLNELVSEVVTAVSDCEGMIKNLHGSASQVAEGNKLVKDETISVSSSTQEITTVIADMSQTMEGLSEKARNTYESSQSGAGIIESAISNLQSTLKVVDKTMEQISALNDLSGEIEKALSMINNLADQTNLLALNAAIEAARAGDAGRGFSVVADEVRSLSEDTVKATDQITRIVDTLNKSANQAIQTVNSGADSLREIEVESNKASVEMKKIIDHADESSRAAEDIASAIFEIAQTSETVQSDIESVATKVSDDSDAIQSIALNTDDIQNVVHRLSEQSSKFRV